MTPKVLGRSLRRKVMVLVLGTTMLALGLAGSALVIYDLRSYERASTTDLATQAEVLARASAPALSFGDRRDAEKDLSVMQARPRITAAALYTRDGKLFATYVAPGLLSRGFPEAAAPEGHRVENGEIQLFRRVVENGEMVGTVYLRATYDPFTRMLDYMSIIGIVMVMSLAAAAALLARLQGSVTQPILDVARVSRGVVEKRDYSQRVRKTTNDEVGELVDAFNQMITEVGRRNAELREADQRKDEFLATLAHELRNPLAPVRNALEILRLVGHDPEKALRAREMMERQVAQMVRLVDDLLDVSRITTGKLGVRKALIDLGEPVRDGIETVRPFILSRQHHLQIELPAEKVVVEGDRTRLSQVVTNLLNNAAKYTPPGGAITVSLTRDDYHGILRVSDNGVGLEPESLSRIFDMFVQVDRSLERSQAGLGVGLTLARRLVELHGGSIDVASDGTGQGSTFTVRIPLALAHIEELGPDTRVARSPSAVRRVLLADDNVDFVNSLGDLLVARGHDVRIARDGAEALAAAEEFRPDVAFLDIGMPKVHGYEVARRLRQAEATSRCLLVAVTGWGQENDRRRAREAGFDRHLVKPVVPADIEAIVDGAIVTRTP
jgi:signal transduction histidine kinase/CheY-like chemotaxis protein